MLFKYRKLLPLLLLLLLILPDAWASRGFYTIQTGTFLHKRLRNAERMYDILSDYLSDESRDYLRIEKGLRYYIVRTGRFGSRREARPILRKIRSRFPDAFLLYQTLDDPSRYIRLYEYNKREGVESPTTVEKPSQGKERLPYSIRVGRFLSIEQATEELKTLLQAVGESSGGTLRIEKSGKYYTLWAGEFGSYEEARSFLDSHSAHLSGVIIKRTAQKEPDNDLSAEKATQDQEFLTDAELGTTGMNPELQRKMEEISSLYYNGDYGRAASLIRDALKRWPDNSDLHAWYGATLLNMNYPVKAYREYKKAIDISPDVPDYHAGAGFSLLNVSTKRLEQSVRAFKKALEIDPENAVALEGLGSVYVSINRTDRAMEIYEKLRGIDIEAANRLYNLIKSGVKIPE